MATPGDAGFDADQDRVVLELSPSGGGEPRSVTLRSLGSQADYEACEALEREIWGQALAVPASLLMVSQKVGGVTAGAFDESGRLLAMVFGLTGPRDGRLVHWSHMLAVRSELQGLGLGRRLKLFQRRLVRRLGVETMLWTYDPLVARNAHLNINRLGARPVEYLEDLYGAESDSHLHEGLGTDRFVVEWTLGHDGLPGEADDEAWHEAPLVNTTPDGVPLQVPLSLPAAPVVRVEVPVDVQQAKAVAPEAGSRWRACTRQAFQHYLVRGHAVVGFYRDADGDRCFYVLAAGGEP